MDAYQAAYDAVRSRIGNADIGAAVHAAIRECGIDHHVWCATNAIAEAATLAAQEYKRPSAVYRPALGMDGNQWVALYGANLMEGVAGFGDTPALAMADFDRNWEAQRIRAKVGVGRE